MPPPSAVSAFCFHFPPRGPFPHAFRVLSNHRPQPCAPDVARCPPLSPVFHVLFPPALLIHFIIIMISIIIINSIFVSLFDYLINPTPPLNWHSTEERHTDTNPFETEETQPERNASIFFFGGWWFLFHNSEKRTLLKKLRAAF